MMRLLNRQKILILMQVSILKGSDTVLIGPLAFFHWIHAESNCTRSTANLGDEDRVFFDATDSSDCDDDNELHVSDRYAFVIYL